MKGTLRKTETGWQVEYQVINSFRFLPVSPYLEKYYFLDEDADGGEVEFEIEDFWETGMESVIKVAELKRKSPPELLHRDGTPMRSYSSPKIQELLDEIKLEEISKEQLEKERNPAYKYFDIDKKEQKKKLVELMDEDGKDGLYDIPDSGKETADYIDRHIIESMKELAKEGHLKNLQIPEITDEEIKEYAKQNASNYYEFIRAIKWYKEELQRRRETKEPF